MGNTHSCCFPTREVTSGDVIVKQKVDQKSAEQPGKPEKCALDSTAIPTDLILNALDPENGPAAGMPYKVHYLGPPAPPCEPDRHATAKCGDFINKADPDDPEIVSILKLTKSMFKAPVALVALFEDKRVYVAQEDGGVIPVGEFPWRFTLCAWSLAYNNPQILVIPDTLQDARFRENDKVVYFPKVRFYCGAPLVASNGHRLGTLCFADVEPRPGFDAASCSVMNNLSELVVRHLEKDIALKLKERDNVVLQQSYGQLQRTLDCFDHSVVLLDVSTEGWTMLHMNAAFTKLTGIDRTGMLGKQLSDLFDGFQGLALPNPELRRAAEQCLDFQVTSATLKQSAAPEGVVVTARPFVLTFRPASREGLDDSVVPIGIPAFLKPNTTTTGGGAAAASPSRAFYFMSIDTIKPENLAAGRRSSIASSVTFNSSSSEAVDGLELGHLLGKGSFGSVYYGSWMGTPVAVKVVDHDLSTTSALDGTALEAVLGKELHHPNIVQTMKYVHRKMMRAHNGTTSITLNSMDSMATLGGPTKGTASSSKPDPVPEIDHEGPGSADKKAVEEEAGGHWPVIDFEERTVEGSANSVDWPALPLDSQPGCAAMDKVKNCVSSSANNHDSTASMCQGQTWLLLEYCDKGCLQEAIDRGWLRTERSALSGGPNMAAVVATATEVARALAYLHSQNVVHGDLSSWNCMLCSSGSQAQEGGRNFVAKVGDFGLARSLEIRSKIQTRSYGTLTHMPPETLMRGIISKSTDVYSFGVLLWQIYTSSRPWAGLTHSQIIMLVGSQGAKLQFPPDTPAGYRDLAMKCMATDPTSRPTFEEVVRLLHEVKETLLVE